MTTWIGGHFSRRQFLGGVGAAGVAVAIPLPRLRRPAGADRVAQIAQIEQSAGKPLPASFSDDFNREFAGSRLWRWETSNCVRVFGSTAYGREMLGGIDLDDPAILRGRGMVVALEGDGDHPSIAGRMRTVDSFAFEAGRRYCLEFLVAGSHLASQARGLARSLEARIPEVGASTTVRLPSRARFQPVRLEFTPSRTTASPIEFVAGGAPGRGGLLLDEVHLAEAA